MNFLEESAASIVRVQDLSFACSTFPLKPPYCCDFLTIEDGTDMLSRNVGKPLPHDAA
jgi:hypothetical protein